MVDYNRYPAMDANNNFPPLIRNKIAASSEIKNVVDVNVTKAMSEYKPAIADFALASHGNDVNFLRPNAKTVHWVGWVTPKELDVQTDILFAIDEPPFDIYTSLNWFSLYQAEDVVGADGAAVASWPGKFGQPLTPTGDNKPTKELTSASLNGQPAILFNDSPLASPVFTSALPQPYTLVMVNKYENMDSFSVGKSLEYKDPSPRMYRSGTGDYRMNANSTIASKSGSGAAMRFHEAIFRGTTGVYNVNGDSVSGFAGNLPHNQLLLGGVGSGMRIAMVGIIRGVLTDKARQDLRGYITAKYGIAFT